MHCFPNTFYLAASEQPSECYTVINAALILTVCLVDSQDQEKNFFLQTPQ